MDTPQPFRYPLTTPQMWEAFLTRGAPVPFAPEPPEEPVSIPPMLAEECWLLTARAAYLVRLAARQPLSDEEQGIARRVAADLRLVLDLFDGREPVG